MTPQPIIPIQRSKKEWLQRHKELMFKVHAKYMENIFIGDSILENFNRKEHSDIWEKHFSCNSLNLSMKGDKIENAFWRILNGELPKFTKNIFLMIGTNNVTQDSSNQIVNNINYLMYSIKSICVADNYFVMGILPRDHPWSSTRRI